MKSYKMIELDNGDILLEKIEIDNTKYSIVTKDNGDILLKKIKYINIVNIADLEKYDMKKSQIEKCLINDNFLTKLKYHSICNYIYDLINDGIKIIKNTKLNIKTIIKNNEGFQYLDNLGISVQRVDSNKCLLEIINQCIKNNISISMKIKLLNNKFLNLKF